MRYLTVRGLAEILNGIFVGDDSVLDERVLALRDTADNLQKGEIYFPRALKTGSKIEGYQKLKHNYVHLSCVVDQKRLNEIKEIKTLSSFILIDDYDAAAMKLVSYLRSQIDQPIISITGTVGKTCTVGMVASVLSQQFKVINSAYYQNIPRNYCEPMYEIYKGGYDIAVLESAETPSYKYGDFTSDIAVATNVGEAHLELYETIDRIFELIRSILKLVRPTGICFVDGCDEYLKRLTGDESLNLKLYGMCNSLEYHSELIENLGLKGVKCDLVHGNDRVNVTIPMPGLQFINPALVSFAIGLELGVSLENIKKGIEGYKTSKLRSKIYETGYISIIEDCYNASPKSVKAAADTLSELKGRKVLILGDMMQLGLQTAELHQGAITYIARSKVDLLVSVGLKGVSEIKDADSVSAGEGVKKAIDSCPNAIEFVRVSQPSELINILPSLIKKGDTVFVKGARIVSSEFHEIVVQLRKIGIAPSVEQYQLQIKKLAKHNKWLTERKEYYMNRLETVKQSNGRLKRQNSELEQRIEQLENSSSWKLTAPIRLVVGFIKGK